MRTGDNRKIGCCIGEAVDGIGKQGLTSAEIAGCKFYTRKNYIRQKSNPGNFADICVV